MNPIEMRRDSAIANFRKREESRREYEWHATDTKPHYIYIYFVDKFIDFMEIFSWRCLITEFTSFDQDEKRRGHSITILKY